MLKLPSLSILAINILINKFIAKTKQLQLEIHTLNMKFKDLESDGYAVPSITQYNKFDDLLGKCWTGIYSNQYFILI